MTDDVWTDDDDEPDEWSPEFDADPSCDRCFGEGGWGDQDTGWTDCPDCFDAWLADLNNPECR